MASTHLEIDRLFLEMGSEGDQEKPKSSGSTTQSRKKQKDSGSPKGYRHGGGSSAKRPIPKWEKSPKSSNDGTTPDPLWGY